MVSLQFQDMHKCKILCRKIVPSYASFNKTEYRKTDMKRQFLAKVKQCSAFSEEFKAQNQIHIQAELNGEMEIIWDPCAVEKCIKGISWTHNTYSDLVITGLLSCDIS